MNRFEAVRGTDGTCNQMLWCGLMFGPSRATIPIMMVRSKMRRWAVGGLLGTVLAVGLSGLALAETSDRDQPMNIESDALRYESQQQRSIFSGNVIMSKGSIQGRGARLEVQQDATGNQNAILSGASGRRAFFRQKREGLDEFIEGEAETIEYDGKSDIVRFVGRAEMRRLAGTRVQDEVMGSVITYNNVTEVYTVDGSAQSGGTPTAAPGKRVRAVLAPRSASSHQSPGSATGKEAVPLHPSGELPGTGSAQ